MTHVLADPEDKKRYADFYAAPVEFGHDWFSMSLSKSVMDKPLDTHNLTLFNQSVQVCSDYLARIDKSEIVAKVYALAHQYYRAQNFSEESIADEMNMGLRTLQRKLKAAGTSYESVVNSTRCQMAIQYMNDSNYSISEISYLLGFSGAGAPSNFGRAFKRWTGLTPNEFRARRNDR